MLCSRYATQRDRTITCNIGTEENTSDAKKQIIEPIKGKIRCLAASSVDVFLLQLAPSAIASASLAERAFL